MSFRRMLWFVLSLGVLVLTFGTAPVNLASDAFAYHNADMFDEHVDQLVQSFPFCMSIDRSCLSFKSHPIHVVKMTNSSTTNTLNGKPKVKVVMVFGEHAREFIPVESFFAVTHNLTRGLLQPPQSVAGRYSRFVLDNMELYFVGLVNPDGRRRLEKTGNYCWRGGANGVDIERNWDWEFGGPGSSSDPRSEEFNGKLPFSDPEARCLRDLIKDVEPAAVLAMHSGARQIFIPFADTKSRIMKREHFNTVAELNLAAKIKDACGDYFTSYGVTYKINDYSADGTMMDYVAEVLKVPYALTFELYGELGDLPDCFIQFNPPASQADAVLQRFQPLYETAFLELLQSVAGLAYAPANTNANSATEWALEPGARQIEQQTSDLLVKGDRRAGGVSSSSTTGRDAPTVALAQAYVDEAGKTLDAASEHLGRSTATAEALVARLSALASDG